MKFNGCVVCSILGNNNHHGTPVNPVAPNRVPGGSSSGSAVAVAADFVDFSLGEFIPDFKTSIKLPFVLLQFAFVC